MDGAEFSALVADIKENGLREPIILHEGMILDGGNRYRACVAAGVEPQFMQFGGGNLVAYVLSANLHRRHMTAGQQAAIVASAQDWAKAQKQGRDGNGQAVDRLATVADRAAQSGASRVTQMKADKVSREAPELAKKVGLGEVSLPSALKQISPPKPAPEQPAPEPDEYDGGPDEAEIQASLDADAADRRTLDMLLAADDKLAAAHAEIKRLNAEVAVLKGQRNQFQNEAAEWKRRAKRAEREAERAGRTKGA